MIDHEGFGLHIVLVNPKTKEKFNCPCVIPKDCVGMSLDRLSKSYGPHIIAAVHDLLKHKAFLKGLEKKKLIITGNDSA